MSDDSQVVRAKADGDSSVLLAPSVGIFTPSVARGQLVSAGQSIGTMEVLGVCRALIVPDGVEGRVTERFGDGRTRVAVQYGDALIAISRAAFGAASNADAPDATATDSSLSFVAPMSGRFYGRPSPNEPAFVSTGDTVTHGQTVGLLEVMKTFNRLVYEGEGLPASATVEQVVPADGDDVIRGHPILLLGSSKG